MDKLILGLMAAFYFARYLIVAAVVLIVIAILLKIAWGISDKMERKYHD